MNRKKKKLSIERLKTDTDVESADNETKTHFINTLHMLKNKSRTFT